MDVQKGWPPKRMAPKGMAMSKKGGLFVGCPERMALLGVQKGWVSRRCFSRRCFQKML
jgi:hypothetical protein